jgi:ankyrin repeat protein
MLAGTTEGVPAEAVGVLPAEAQSLCDGDCGDDDTWKRRIKATVQFVVRAAPYAHVSKLAKANVRRVLGLGHCFTTNLAWAGAWDELQGGIRAHMRQLGGPLDDVFHKLDLKRRLGDYDPQVPAATGGGGGGGDDDDDDDTERLMQLVPTACASVRFSGGEDLVAQDDLECTYIHFLRLLALALDDAFQKHVNMAFKKADVRLVGGGVCSGGIKSYERMRNKMLAPEDHGRRTRPRPAHNVDVVRCLATFATADDMLTGFDVVRRHVFSHGYAKFKNGMKWDDVEAEKRYHLRVVLGTGNFTHPVRRKMGQLRADPEVRRLWDSYLDSQTVPGSVDRGTWKRQVQAALQWLDDVPAGQDVSMLCEVQMLLRQYIAARMGMHQLYKIVRADTPQRLQADFDKYRIAHEAAVAHQHAGAAELKLACRDGAVDALRLLLARPAAQKAEEVAAALEVACEYSRPQCVKLVLASGTLFSPEHLASALRAAARGALAQTSFASDVRRAGVVTQLIQAKADVDKGRTEDGATPTCLAALNGHADSVRVLVQAKADVDKAKTTNGSTPALLAAWQGHVDALRVLVLAKADVDKAKTDDSLTPALMAAWMGHAESLQVLVQARVDVDKAKANTGATPACIAAQFGHVVSLHVLLQAKAGVDKAKTDGTTPAFMAAQRGHLDALHVLVQAKADVDKATTLDGSTPAYAAAQRGHASALRVLVQAKADVDKATTDGSTPASVAAQNGHASALRVLLQAKADVDMGRTVAALAGAGHGGCTHGSPNGTVIALVLAENGHTSDARAQVLGAKADVGGTKTNTAAADRTEEPNAAWY